MPLLTYGSLADSNSTFFEGPESILSTKGTDVIAVEADGQIFAYDPCIFYFYIVPIIRLIVPGFAFVYSGMVRGKNALSLILLPLLSMAVVSLQFWFWGCKFR